MEGNKASGKEITMVQRWRGRAGQPGKGTVRSMSPRFLTPVAKVMMRTWEKVGCGGKDQFWAH
jgi:hypothetical protein